MITEMQEAEIEKLRQFYIAYVTSLGFTPIGKDARDGYQIALKDRRVVVGAFHNNCLDAHIDIDALEYNKVIFDGIVIENENQIKFLFENSLSIATLLQVINKEIKSK